MRFNGTLGINFIIIIYVQRNGNLLENWISYFLFVFYTPKCLYNYYIKYSSVVFELFKSSINRRDRWRNVYKVRVESKTEIFLFVSYLTLKTFVTTKIQKFKFYKTETTDGYASLLNNIKITGFKLILNKQ